MNEKQREAIMAVLARRRADLDAIGPVAAKHSARARFINYGMARYTESGEFVWLPQYGGPDIATAA